MGRPVPIMPFGDWRGTLVGGTTAQGVKLPCPDGKCLIYWPGSRYRAFLERDRPVYQRNWFGSLTSGQENPNGLMYMRNRYYNPITGAFTQTDPIGLAGGLNSYGYAEGNPVTYSDPYGLRVIVHGSAEYQRRVLNALMYVAARSETFRETWNALVSSDDVLIEIGADFLPECKQAGLESCHRRAPFGGRSLIRLTLQDEDLETGFVGAHELFHAAGAHSRRVRTSVHSSCGNDHEPHVAHQCTNPLEKKTREEVQQWQDENREWHEQNAARTRSTNP